MQNISTTAESYIGQHCIQGSSMNTEDICCRTAGSEDILKTWQVQFLLEISTGKFYPLSSPIGYNIS